MKTAIQAVIGGVVVYIVATTLISTMITGTGTGDTLNKMGAFNRKVRMITLQIRGTLNAFGRMLTAELSRMMNVIRACGETKRSAALKKVDDIVRYSMKVEKRLHYYYRADRVGCRCHSNNSESLRLIPGY